MNKIIAIILVASLFGCKSKKSPDNAVTICDTTIAIPSTSREKLVAQLAILQNTIQANDTLKIAELLRIPAADSIIQFYSENERLNNAIAKNGQIISQPIFLKYYADITSAIQLPDIKELFKQVIVDSLIAADEIEKVVSISTEPCAKSYKIQIAGDTVLLIINEEANEHYQPLKKPLKNDVPANSSEFCEHTVFWQFRFDGSTLKFERIFGAG